MSVIKELNRIMSAILGTSIRLLLILMVVFLLYEGSVRGYRFGYRLFSPDTWNEQQGIAELPALDRDFEVHKGETIEEIAADLADQDLIWNRNAFWLTARFYEYKPQPGVYRINRNMNIREILDTISGMGTEEKDTKEISAKS
ncbi:MAG: endolytic transglycosylase MltG [Bacillota bacterium]|uniref:YceG-like family protein n=1 Tax=[Clostridium] aminophilum TaxID=1526 RepID=A0A1I6JNL8_9FIRM|nr:endolytic transglycosylase MltG [Bacillota bacterium]SFR80501.1 YceG-like family protein [[Clostridium] aminophilum]